MGRGNGVEPIGKPGERRPIEIIEHLRQHDQVEMLLRHRVGYAHSGEADMRQGSATVCCPIQCGLRNVDAKHRVGATCQLFGKDADRAAELDRSSIALSRQGGDGVGVFAGLVIARLETPGIGVRRVERVEIAGVARVSGHARNRPPRAASQPAAWSRDASRNGWRK